MTLLRQSDRPLFFDREKHLGGDREGDAQIGGSRPTCGHMEPNAQVAGIAVRAHTAAMIDIYESAVEMSGRFGAVFERDDETAYFYLLDMHEPVGNQIISALDVDTANQLSPDLPVSVRWSEAVAVAGLFVDGILTAILDVRSSEAQGRLAQSEDDHWFHPN